MMLLRRLTKKLAVYASIGLVVLLVLLSCGKQKQSEPEETILVRIGDKTISVNEFIRRAEYTVRPPYCRGNYNLDKKIVLNSLIAEKLMAMEAGEQNEFISSPEVQAYLRGRKEQAMRQWQFYEQAYKKVVLDTASILKTVKLIGRKYKISYFSLEDSVLAHWVSQELHQQNKPFEQVYWEMTQQDSIPRREVEWSSFEHDAILEALFSEPLRKGQVIGPINIDNGEQYIFMKVLGWIDRPAITESQIQTRWKSVSDRYLEREAEKIYERYIRKIMKGKSIEFSPDTFYKIANLLGPVYLPTKSEKDQILKDAYWQLKNDDEKFRNLDSQIKALYQEPFFKVDGQVWTVRDFVEELRVHPLVFRKKRMKHKEFGQQLQFAIMDMIRDKYLAKDAYKKGYDRVNVVQRNVAMWKDNLNYLYYKAKLLREIGADSTDYLQAIEKHLNPYVISLQKKYSPVIEVNTEAFNDIKLTRIDMSAIQPNMPFPAVVPGFPLLTTYNRLDYGRKLNQN